MRDVENELLAKKTNETRMFEPKIQDPLDDVIEIFDEPKPELKIQRFLMSSQLFSCQIKSKRHKNE